MPLKHKEDQEEKQYVLGMSSKRHPSKLKSSDLERAFREADKDKDGCLTQEEYFKVKTVCGSCANNDAFAADDDESHASFFT